MYPANSFDLISSNEWEFSKHAGVADIAKQS